MGGRGNAAVRGVGGAVRPETTIEGPRNTQTTRKDGSRMRLGGTETIRLTGELTPLEIQPVFFVCFVCFEV